MSSEARLGQFSAMAMRTAPVRRVQPRKSMHVKCWNRCTSSMIMLSFTTGTGGSGGHGEAEPYQAPGFNERTTTQASFTFVVAPRRRVRPLNPSSVRTASGIMLWNA
uniref:Uncharacterized protein n=1 Tax=Florenciella parvula TaxID=236787 RepID=A0A7S2FJ23_9STRA